MVIERGAVIGDRVELHAHVHIGRDVRVGQDTTCKAEFGCWIDASLVSRNLQSGAIIGADGFGFAPQEDGSYAKVPQTGNVVIEDNCDIGALTTIDRATWEHRDPKGCK